MNPDPVPATDAGAPTARGEVPVERVAANSVTHWINGEGASGGEGFVEVVNPATGDVAGLIPDGDAPTVDLAVAAAKRAHPRWSASPVEDRIALVRALADFLEAHSEEIAQTITAEMGSPIAMSRAVQASLPVVSARVAAEAAGEFAWAEEVGHSLVRRESIGVVGVITPWNFPLNQAVSKIAYALITGNTVVWKPSEVAPMTAPILMEGALAAGLPPGVINIVHGRGDTAGAAISRHSDVDMITFTGSTRVGRLISAAASDTVKRVSLELGGKSASIVLPDADLDLAVASGLASAWFNSGQTCAACTRMLVPAQLHDEVVARLVAEARNHVVGDPLDETTVIGPMASPLQQQRVNGHISRALSRGTSVALGARLGSDLGFSDGCFVDPTIFVDVDPSAPVAQEEVFGPVLTVIKYESEDEAVTIANNTIYGLCGAVYGDPDHAVRIAERMRTGLVDINGAYPNNYAPFGGYKQSGNGRENGKYGLCEFSEIKAIQRPQ
jgi:aldehyde dehydrogenase (NAD+)